MLAADIISFRGGGAALHIADASWSLLVKSGFLATFAGPIFLCGSLAWLSRRQSQVDSMHDAPVHMVMLRRHKPLVGIGLDSSGRQNHIIRESLSVISAHVYGVHVHEATTVDGVVVNSPRCP